MQAVDIFAESASSQEKITLACNNICWIANGLTQLMASHGFMLTQTTDKAKYNALMQAMANHSDVLEKAAEALKPLLEELSNYMNTVDGVTTLDIRVLTPGNKIVLLGMDELERSYHPDEK